MLSPSGLPIDLLDYKDRLRFSNEGNQVFCKIRNKYVAFTPEEMVRQLLIFTLLDCEYSEGLMAVEAPLKVNRLDRRADVILYDMLLKPWLLAECKSPDVKLSQNVLDQALRYNLEVNASFILITNGPELMCFDCTDNEPILMNQLPRFKRLNK